MCVTGHTDRNTDNRSCDCHYTQLPHFVTAVCIEQPFAQRDTIQATIIDLTAFNVITAEPRESVQKRGPD